MLIALFFRVQKLGQAAAAAGTAGSYLQGHFTYPAAAQGGMVAPNGMMPVYPFYHYQYHGSQGLGVPAAHFFPPASAAAVATGIASARTAPAQHVSLLRQTPRRRR